MREKAIRQNSYRFLKVSSAILFIAFLVSAQNDTTLYYSEYGAVGNGVTDDIDAIIRTHNAANAIGARAKVKADAGKTYYIGGANKTAIIQTDTDWGNAKFIIDDSNIPASDAGARGSNVFRVTSKLPVTNLTASINNLQKGQQNIGVQVAYNSMVIVQDNTTRHFIRKGINGDNGQDKKDSFIIDKNGNVSLATPIIYDFNNISSATAYPIDDITLNVTGGEITTKANKAPREYTYYNRGLRVERSNTKIDGVVHKVTGEGESGAPYNGFFIIGNCSNVELKNLTLTGRKLYKLSSDANNSMGTYDLSIASSVNISVINCVQQNDINNSGFWGIMGSNETKNLTFDGIRFSRIDAHRGAHNVTIKNSALGYQGLQLVGSGLLLIENTSFSSGNMISFRNDYGSSWNGEVIVRNCSWSPPINNITSAQVFDILNDGSHNFGYVCYMPEKITIDGLEISDATTNASYGGIIMFRNFHAGYTGNEPYPYRLTKYLVLKDFVTASGKTFRIPNQALVNYITIIRDVPNTPSTFNSTRFTRKSSEITANNNENGNYVGGLIGNSFLDYVINVEETGNYRMMLNAARGGSGGVVVTVSAGDNLDGSNLSNKGSIAIPVGENGWFAFSPAVAAANFNLSAGTQVLRLTVTGSVNIENITLGIPIDIPAAFSSTRFSNKSSEIKVEREKEYLGSLVNGSYVEYLANVSTAGEYKLTINTASGNNNLQRVLSVFSGSRKLADLQVINGDDWEGFAPISANINLSDGWQILRFVSTGAVNIQKISILLAETETSIGNVKESDNSRGIIFANNIVKDKAEILKIILPNKEEITRGIKAVIYDNTGNVVFETRDNVWNLTNKSGRYVANGGYLVIVEVKDRSGKVYWYSAKLGVKR